MILFLGYDKCSTCQKAKKWLEEQSVEFTARPIKEENPTQAELTEWTAKNNFPVKRLVNTHGVLYRSMGLAAKMPEMSEEEILALLATNGMLVKRPILVTDRGMAAGFKAEEWKKLL